MAVNSKNSLLTLKGQREDGGEKRITTLLV